jgi:hypothetical protein
LTDSPPVGAVQARWLALPVVACVLLAGCGGTGTTGVTPDDPQTTLETADTTAKTLPEPLYRLEVRNRLDGPVQATVELTSVDNETTYYVSETTLTDDALRDYSARVENRSEFRATVSVAEDSVSFVVGPDEGYSVWVQNRTDVDVHHTRDAGASTATTAG